MARLQELNSNSFEYNSNGFELGLGSVWPKMFGFFGGAPEYGERIYGNVGDQELR